MRKKQKHFKMDDLYYILTIQKKGQTKTTDNIETIFIKNQVFNIKYHGKDFIIQYKDINNNLIDRKIENTDSIKLFTRNKYQILSKYGVNLDDKQ